MSTNEKETNDKTDGFSLDEKLDLALRKLNQIIESLKKPDVQTKDEGPKDPPPTPPNP